MAFKLKLGRKETISDEYLRFTLLINILTSDQRGDNIWI
jgi:hypothetical protein